MSELENIPEISETVYHTPASGSPPPPSSSPPAAVAVVVTSTAPTGSSGPSSASQLNTAAQDPLLNPPIASPAPDLLSPKPQRARSSSPGSDIRAATPLEHQVAGHAGVMADESGELVIKPALAREIAFYTHVASASRHSSIGMLRPFLPKFYGTLRLEGRQEGGRVVAIDGAGEVPESVVLENISHPFTHPCILDAKLGQTLHGPDATPEKAARMEKKARDSTIKEMGMRWTGCQTWHAPTETFISSPRSFGYALTADRLPEGMARFFPLPTDTVPHLSDDETPNPNAPEHYTAHAMPPALTARVLRLLDEEISRLETTLESVEIRAVGSSLLVAYEGDTERLTLALDRWDAKKVQDAAKSFASRDNGDDESDDDDDDLLSSESDSDDDSDLDDDGFVKADKKRARRAPPIAVRLIDFAHTWLVDGDGPDAGVLRGLSTVRALVNGRLEEVEKWMAEHSPATSPTRGKSAVAGAGADAGAGAAQPASQPIADKTPSSPTAPGRPITSPKRAVVALQ